MKKQQYIAVTGFYGTGSSGVIDLLKEFEDCQIASPINSEYEHAVFYSPGGLFDLSCVLLSPSISPFRSDIAVNNFIDCTNRLDRNNFGWLGQYHSYYGDTFKSISNDFVSKISKVKLKPSSAHLQKTHFSFLKVLKQLGGLIFYNRPITKLGRVYDYDKKLPYFSMPTESEFCEASKEYTLKYMKMCSINSESIQVFDHLIWPQETLLLSKLFPSETKAIVVIRDPRDVYILNKYYWHKPPVSVSKPFYPTNPNEFVKEWKTITNLKTDNNPNVLYLHFEDLVYKYEETVNTLVKFLGSELNSQIQFSFFNPEKSIENTQVFTVCKDWQTEVSIIEKELAEYLYHFPYFRVPDKKKWFDTELQLKKR